MYTLKLDWSDERMDAVEKALRSCLADQESSFITPDVQGALDDITLYRETTEKVIAEITARRGPYYQKVTNLVIEARKPDGEWFTWWHIHEKAKNWRLWLPGTAHRGSLEFRLVRRTIVITDEVLGTEGD